jgi:queuosine precursor transporter
MFISFLIEYMQYLNPLLVKGVMFLFCMGSIVLFARFFGKEGLYVYSVIAIIIANIQVLKAVEIPPLIHPVPLGNVVFTSLFLVSDIITECYGKAAAQKGIWLGFAASIMFSIIMIVTIGLKPLEDTNPANAMFVDYHNAINLLFTPSMSILISSLAAYFISLWFDVFVFYAIKMVTGDGLLWVRSFVSSSLGIVVDNIVFSLCAWIVFAVKPIGLSTVIDTYIIGALSMRLFLTIISIPVFYWVRKIVRNFEKAA